MSDESLFVGESPGFAARAALHLARVRLLQECDGTPGGHVTWAHPRAIDVQLAAMAWNALSEAERDEGEEAFAAAHRCDLLRCDLPRRLGARSRRTA